MLTTFLDEFMEPMYTPEALVLYTDIILFMEAGPYETIQDDLMAMALAPVSTSDPRDLDEGDDFKVKSEITVKGEDQIRDEIVAFLQTALIKDMRTFGVEFSEEATIDDMFRLLKGMYMIDNYDDVSTLIQLVGIDTDDTERLATVLALLIEESMDNICTLIDSVSPSLIRGIQKLMINRADSAYDQMESDEQKNYLLRIRAYREYVASRGHQHLKLYDFIAATLMGQVLEAYLDSGVLNDLIENNNMEKLSLEIYGLALVSSDGVNDPLTAIRATAERVIPDSSRVTMLINEVIKVNGGYSKFLQEAINRDKAGGIING